MNADYMMGESLGRGGVPVELVGGGAVAADLEGWIALMGDEMGGRWR